MVRIDVFFGVVETSRPKCGYLNRAIIPARKMASATSSHQCLSVRVTGRVQGVYFRAFTRNQARRLGLSGWVRNEYDGSVSLIAEGPREVLEHLLVAVRRGPAGARVDHVSVDWAAATGEYDGFAVRF